MYSHKKGIGKKFYIFLGQNKLHRMLFSSTAPPRTLFTCKTQRITFSGAFFFSSSFRPSRRSEFSFILNKECTCDLRAAPASIHLSLQAASILVFFIFI